MIKWKRAFAGLLSLAFFFSQCVLAHAYEANIWGDRRKSIQLASAALPAIPKPLSPVLPPIQIKPTFVSKTNPMGLALSPMYGTVRKILNPAGGTASKTVVFIQDIHRNTEAQTNIAGALSDLLKNGQVDLVALEGESDTLDLSRFHSFADQAAIKNAADFLLNEKELSGPAHTLLTTPSRVASLVGIDDAEHYQKNIEAYRGAAPLVEKAKAELAKEAAALQLKKQAVLNEALKDFDVKASAYHAGEMELGEYATVIANEVKQSAVENKPTSNILSEKQIASLPAVARNDNFHHFLQALNAERTLDFKWVERERTHLLEALLPRLTKNESDKLIRCKKDSFFSKQIVYKVK
jgi:hypothetical protein